MQSTTAVPNDFTLIFDEIKNQQAVDFMKTSPIDVKENDSIRTFANLCRELTQEAENQGVIYTTFS